MTPDLNAILVFVKLVELKSFSATAWALRVPRSTVSLRISQLEEHLGVRLFERTTRSVRVTDAGSAYYREVAPAPSTTPHWSCGNWVSRSGSSATRAPATGAAEALRGDQRI